MNNLKISIKKYVTIKLINCLSSEFETYIIVLNKQTRKNKKLSDLNELLKSLKEEENRIKRTITVAAVRSEREEYREGWENKEYFNRFNSEKDDESDRPYCKICFQNHKEKCYQIKIKCYKCHKLNYIQRNCFNNKKNAESTLSALQSSESESIKRKQMIDMIKNNIAQFSFNENIEFIEWILNFECTIHICNNRFRFINSTYRKHAKTVQTIINQIVMFLDKESVTINLAVTKIELLLKEVLHVSQVKYNYININVLFKRKINVFFHHIQFKLMMNDEIIEFIDKMTDCYELYNIWKEEQRVMTLIKKFTNLAVWHDRTAHLGYRNILKMRKLVKEMKELKTLSSKEICKYCMMNC